MPEPTKDELLARIAELEKQAGTRKSGKLEFKIGEKGDVSVYGLGRFPVTQTPRRDRGTPGIFGREQNPTETEERDLKVFPVASGEGTESAPTANPVQTTAVEWNAP